MAFKDENVVLARIDEIEAVVNGLIFYLASKESGLELDLDDPKVKDFLRANVTRPFDSRLVFSQAIGPPAPSALDGYFEANAIARIVNAAQKLRETFR